MSLEWLSRLTTWPTCPPTETPPIVPERLSDLEAEREVWEPGELHPRDLDDLPASSAVERPAADDGSAPVVAPSPPGAPGAGQPELVTELMMLRADNTRIRSAYGRLLRLYDDQVELNRQVAERLEKATVQIAAWEQRFAAVCEERDEWRDAHDAVERQHELALSVISNFVLNEPKTKR